MTTFRFSVLLLILACAHLDAWARGPAPAPTPTPPPVPSKRTESFWTRLAEFFGVSSNPDKQKGPGDVVKTGHIWVVELAAPDNPTELSREGVGGYRSPVFLSDNQNVVALKGEAVVKVSNSDGSEQPLFPSIRGISKLVGLSKDAQGGEMILALIEVPNRCPVIAMLPVAGGDWTPVPYAGVEDDRLLIDHLRDWTRSYDGGFVLQVSNLENCTGDKRAKTNICLKRVDAWQQITRCGVANCSQPNLSPDRTKVVYIKDR